MILFSHVFIKFIYCPSHYLSDSGQFTIKPIKLYKNTKTKLKSQREHSQATNYPKIANQSEPGLDAFLEGQENGASLPSGGKVFCRAGAMADIVLFLVPAS